MKVEAIPLKVARAEARATAAPATPAAPPAEAVASEVELIRATDIRPEAIRWIWPGWVAQGKLHILAGSPGTGKTTLALKMGATVTVGGRWPDGATAPLGDVLVWSGEDDPADTLVPRLMACGADLSRVHFIGDVADGGRKRAFDPATDMPRLIRTAARLKSLRLLVVDPIVSAVAGDSHKNAEVRRSLQPLVDLGMQVGAGIVGITHFSKGTSGRDPVERITASIAFGALARVVMCAAKPSEEDEGASRKLVRAKSNIGPDGGGFEYDLPLSEVQTGLVGQGVSWGTPIDGSARDILATAEEIADGTGARSEAEYFLRDILAFGPVPTKKLQAAAKDAGLSWATVRRAKSNMGVKSEKEGMSGGWAWVLPAAEGAHDKAKVPNPESVSVFGKDEHLREWEEEL